jgi:hypothetical protein
MGSADLFPEKLFDRGSIQSGGFVEYITSNLQPGKYPFYFAFDYSAYVR